MTERLVIKGGRIIDPASGVDMVGDVVIEDGRIAGVGPGGIAAGPAQTLDASGRVVTPGFVDLHAHLRDPGFEYKETIETGTRAAARGGFTTVCAMPNTSPPADNRATIEYVLRTAATTGQVRVLPIGCVTKARAGKELAELADLAEAGAVAFSDDGDCVADGGVMRRALEYASGLGLAVIQHAEDPALSRRAPMHEGWVATRLGLAGQPSAAEEAIVARDIAIAEELAAAGYPVRLHVAHVSVKGAVDTILLAKARGVPVTAEVTPHHLTLTHEAVAWRDSDGTLAYDTDAKVNPPLRTREDTRACVAALGAGGIDAIATDHAPHASVEKDCEFEHAAFGISGLETALGLVLTLYHGRQLDLPAIVAALTVGPVRALGLERFVPGVGTLRPGAPADVTVFDPDEEWVVDPAAFASKGKNTPLAGRTLRGRVVATVYGGRVVFRATPEGVHASV
jgi:dihydroorotase